jgi:hypothetical protein
MPTNAAMAKKQPPDDDDENAETAPAGKAKQATMSVSTHGVVMTTAIASAFVSVGVWIAHDFFHI